MGRAMIAQFEDDDDGTSCQECGSLRVHSTLVRSTFWHEERLVAVENIPATVCENCQASFFAREVAGALDLMRVGGHPVGEPSKMLLVPVYEFQDMAWGASADEPESDQPDAPPRRLRSQLF